MDEQPSAFTAGSGVGVAALKAVIARYDQLRDAAHSEVTSVIMAASRLRAVITTKQIISTEASELLDAAYAAVGDIITIVTSLADALAGFDPDA